ncbi:3-ketoacyl-ACP reductase [Verticiella sediminum]|uniref:3-ketoacyl-ACP reductase n=1 Tax=Verticiella sediminum TaxID=1247510 RepID=A0A556ACG9_9BURK|nr:3-ketoacyl-ACP reductase [Verticiella sediminum]TSH90584.1 3-ketoacyl-ACP reductase [Verticiella sediminum]
MHEQAQRPDPGVAIVTGGRRGIGGATAVHLARAGYSVAVVDVVRDADADETVRRIDEAGGKAAFVQADIGDVDAQPAWIARIVETLGPITCLVNNAGVNVPVRGDMLEATPEAFDRVVGINLRGTFFLTQAVARHMVQTAAPGVQRSIFVVSSANAHMASPEKAVYCLAKSALPMLARMFAARLGEHGIDVFEIQPGLIKTTMNEAVWDTYGQAIANGVSPTRRWGTPDDVAQVISSVARGLMPFCTGTTIPVGGGLHIHRL